MKKILLYIFSFGCLLVYALSLNRPFMEWWADWRTYTLNAAYARARYGDLYSNCFLPGYMDTAYIPLTEYKYGNGTTDLYILHDSYLEGKIKKENFIGLNKLILANYRGDGVTVKPDKTKKNILLIECAERNAEWRLTDTATAFSQINFSTAKPAIVNPETYAFADYFFNRNINQNLEFSLYDYEYFIPVKNLKAYINFSLFGRLPKDVGVSTDKKYLLLNETIDPSSATGSFTPVSLPHLEGVLFYANRISMYYKKRGFDEVYFSIIPNPVSIVDLNRNYYNRKAELLEDYTLLHPQFISVYKAFKNCKTQVYRRDDSHWNGRGIQIWIDEVNKKLNP